MKWMLYAGVDAASTARRAVLAALSNQDRRRLFFPLDGGGRSEMSLVATGASL